jgi:phage tail-like protein
MSLLPTFSLIRMAESMLGIRFDPAPAHIFYVEISGVVVALFTECSGLSLQREVLPRREGGRNDITHYLPGPVTQEKLTLKRGLSISQELWDWFNEGVNNFAVDRKNISIIHGAPGHNFINLLTNSMTTSLGGSTTSGVGGFLSTATGGAIGIVKVWDIEDAYPVSWEASALDTSSTAVAFETVVVAHHGISLSSEVGTPMSPGASALEAGLSLF